jgi:blocked-early-in-transport protein 1
MSGARDPESQERDNDTAINHMSDRVAMLKKITSDIHGEAESHHRLLDGGARDAAYLPSH